jgi:hypothetical protein
MFALFSLMGAPLIGTSKKGDAPAEVQKLDEEITALEEQRRQVELGGGTAVPDENLKTMRQRREFFAAASGLPSNRPDFEGIMKTPGEIGRGPAGGDRNSAASASATFDVELSKNDEPDRYRHDHDHPKPHHLPISGTIFRRDHGMLHTDLGRLCRTNTRSTSGNLLCNRHHVVV